MLQLAKGLKKRASSIKSAIAGLKFDPIPGVGLYLPSSNVIARGHYDLYKNGVFLSREYNLLTTEGMTYLVSLLGAGSKLTTWYVALYAGAISPTTSWTAANFTSTATEITSGSEGYSESTRVTWVPGTAAASAINNNASAASFTIVTATTLTVNGIGLLSASAKGATTGTLLSASRFGSAKSFDNGDVFGVKYGVTLANAA